MTSKPHFLTLVTGDASSYTQSNYGDYADLFERLLQRDGDRWSRRDVVRGGVKDLPPHVDAVLVTGSAATAHERMPWMRALESTLLDFLDRSVPVLGVCFGHQILALALGGRTERNPLGWEIGSAALTIQSSGPWLPERIEALPPLLQIHRDHVAEAPKTALIHASSSQTAVQMYSVDGLALGVQGHPEFTMDILQDLVKSRVTAGTMSAQHLQDVQQSKQSQPEFWRTHLRSFIEQRSLKSQQGPK